MASIRYKDLEDMKVAYDEFGDYICEIGCGDNSYKNILEGTTLEEFSRWLEDRRKKIKNADIV